MLFKRQCSLNSGLQEVYWQLNWVSFLFTFVSRSKNFGHIFSYFFLSELELLNNYNRIDVYGCYHVHLNWFSAIK